MAATNRLVHLNVVLEQAELLSVAAGGVIDLASTRALAPPVADGSVAVNLSDRKGGIVPSEERDRILSKIRHVFLDLRDPTTGERIVTAIHEPSTSGLLQPGGRTAGDLFLDFANGYYPSTEIGGDSIVTRTVPRGNHIFRPTRRDMLAICAAWGPRIRAGTNWGRVRAIDIVPTVLDLLERSDPPRTEPASGARFAAVHALSRAPSGPGESVRCGARCFMNRSQILCIHGSMSSRRLNSWWMTQMWP